MFVSAITGFEWIEGYVDWLWFRLRCVVLTYIFFAEKYFELLKESKIKGYLGQEKNRFGGESA